MLLPVLLNLLEILIFGFAQWQIAKIACARWPRIRRWLPYLALLLIVGCTMGFSEVRQQIHLSAPLGSWIGAISQYWVFSTSAALYLHLILRRIRPPHDPTRRRALQVASKATLAAPFALLGYGTFIERTNFHVREVDIPMPNLPPDLDGIRIAQVSDIHLSAFLSETDLARVIDATNQARAHLVVVTGDLISGAGDPLDECLRQLARLKSDAGTLGCMGNHELVADALEKVESDGARLGMKFLRMRAQPLRFGNATLNFVGVDYQKRRNRPRYLQGTEQLIVPDATNVLLSHNPDVFLAAPAKGFGLTLSGHTHGGQISVEILDRKINPAVFVTPYTYGLYRNGASAAYVTRGIGTIGVPARIGAPPEVAILRLKKA